MNTILWRWLELICLVAAGVVACAGGAPSDIFPFVHDSAHAGDFQSRFDEATRRKIVAALRSPARDDALRKIEGVRSEMILGEEWFDLAGLVVRPSELPPSLFLGRLRLDYAHFENVDLSGSDLSGALLRGARFVDVTLTQANFDNADLNCADFFACDLREASFRYTRFGTTDTIFRDCTLDEAIFDNAAGRIEISGGSAVNSRFLGAHLVRSRFTQTRLDYAGFQRANVTDSDFFDSSLRGVDFSDAVLTGARLAQARIGRGTRLIRTTLEKAHLGDIVLDDIDLRYLRWPSRTYVLGEELTGDEIAFAHDSTNRTKADEYAKAEVIYRSLADRYRKLGYMAEFRGLRFRAFEARRKYLEVAGGEPIETAWLKIYRTWDGYGTSFRLLFRNALIAVLLFTSIYFIAAIAGRAWFVWEEQSPEAGENSSWYYSVPPHQWLRRRGFLRRLTALGRLFLESALVSIDAMLTFGDHLLRLQSILRMFRRRAIALRPVGGARPLVAFQAVVGLALASSLTAQAVTTLAH
jgi:uncharacterized protein YjbI with pentapeptide repeats